MAKKSTSMIKEHISICSAHREKQPDCPACQATIYDLLPDYDEKHAEAIAAGLHKCVCGFEYYKTTDICPLCSRVREHKCERATTCICSSTALEPNENCPMHGLGEYPPRCKHCGRFMKQE